MSIYFVDYNCIRRYFQKESLHKDLRCFFPPSSSLL